MLPKEIEKTLRQLGDDGDKVRGALERDFAEYAKQTARENPPVSAMLATNVAKPLIRRGIKAAGEWFLRTDDEGFAARLAEVSDRTAGEVARRRRKDPDASTVKGPNTTAGDAGSAGA